MATARVSSALLIALFSFVMSCAADSGDSSDRKVCIVYMGDRPQGDLAQHMSMLQATLGSKRATDSWLYSYKRSFNGFVARLTDEERKTIAVGLQVPIVFEEEEETSNVPLTTVVADVMSAPEPVEQTGDNCPQEVDDLPLTALAKGKEVEKKKRIESPIKEKKSEQKHDAATIPGVVALVTEKTLKEMPPLDQCSPIDPRFGALAIHREMGKLLEGNNERYCILSDCYRDSWKEGAKALEELQATLKDRDAELSQLREQLASRDKDIAARDKDLADRDKELADRKKTLAARDKDLQDVRAALDAANKGHGDLVKAFFCKLLATDDFSKFVSILATTTYGEVQKRILDNVMIKHPTLDLRDHRRYGYVDISAEQTAAEYTANVISPPPFALVETLMKKAETGPLTPELVYQCEVPLDKALSGQEVSYGFGCWPSVAGSSSQSTACPSGEKDAGVGK